MNAPDGSINAWRVAVAVERQFLALSSRLHAATTLHHNPPHHPPHAHTRIAPTLHPTHTPPPPRKKKKKRPREESADDDFAVAAASTSHNHKDDGEDGEEVSRDGGEAAAAAAAPALEKDDGLTETQRRHIARQKEREKKNIKNLVSKSHRERIDEFNQYLSVLTEHNDIPRVSAAGNG
jgi:protein FAM32A